MFVEDSFIIYFTMSNFKKEYHFGTEMIQSLVETCYQGFQLVSGDKFAVIIIDDNEDQDFNQEIIAMCPCLNCQNIIFVLIIDQVLNRLKRQPPLYFCNSYSSFKPKIQDWIDGKERNCDLIISQSFLSDMKCDLLMNITDSKELPTNIQSEIYVKICQNPILEAMMINQTLLKKEHNCHKMLDNRGPNQELIMSEFILNISRNKNLEPPPDMNIPVGYCSHKNPILECLASQAFHDLDSQIDIQSHTDLLDQIIESLENGKVPWPEDFYFMNSSEWIKNMKNNPNFYISYASDASEVMTFEYLLITLASLCFKRTIELVPFSENDEMWPFDANATPSTKKYSIMYFNKASQHNFYLSVLPIISADQRTQELTQITQESVQIGQKFDSGPEKSALRAFRPFSRAGSELSLAEDFWRNSALQDIEQKINDLEDRLTNRMDRICGELMESQLDFQDRLENKILDMTWRNTWMIGGCLSVGLVFGYLLAHHLVI